MSGRTVFVVVQTVASLGGGSGPPRVTPSRGGRYPTGINFLWMNYKEHDWINDVGRCEWRGDDS